jgi:Frizzled/Smoothened family membrane region
MVELFRVEGSLAALSIVGSLLIIISFWSIPGLRRHPTSLVFFMAACDVFFSAKYVITSLASNSTTLVEDPIPCALQSVFAQFFGLAVCFLPRPPQHNLPFLTPSFSVLSTPLSCLIPKSISWNGMISLNLLLQLKNPFANTESYQKFMHIWVWGLAGSTTILMLAFDQWGGSGDGTCWMKNTVWRFMFFIPLFLYLFVGVSTVTAVILRRKALTRQVANDRTISRMITRMSLYVVAFAIAWAGPTIHRVAQFSERHEGKEDPNDPSLLMWLDGIGASLYGFLNAIIWLTNPTFYKTFTKRVLVRSWNWCTGRDGDRVPLLPEFVAEDQDDDAQDFQRLDNLLRKYVISNILTGIESTLSRRSRARTERRGRKASSAGRSLSRNDGDQVPLVDSPVHSSEDDTYRHSHSGEHAHPHLDRDFRKDYPQEGEEGGVNFDDVHYNLESNVGNPFQSFKSGGVDTIIDGGYSSADPHNSQSNFDSVGDLDKLTQEGGLGMWQQGYEFYDYAPEAFRQIRLLSGVTDELYLESLNVAEFMTALEQDQKVRFFFFVLFWASPVLQPC